MHENADTPGCGADFEYSIAVRTMCDFTARRGDLSSRFVPAPSAQQGIAGHAILAARRGIHYRREVALAACHRGLTVRGRADGYDPEGNRLEEFKTHRGDLERMPANQRDLHWAQLETYGALLCMQQSLAEIELALVYFDTKSEAETCFPVRCEAADLRMRFEHRCEAFRAWAIREMRHRRRRNAFLEGLQFPHEQLHSGQRHMAEAIYKAARRDRSLMVQAPTGIGKTVGSMFPLLKAAPAQRLDKILFLTAKTSGRAAALNALGKFAVPPAPAALRVLELVAKAAACRYPGRACEADGCPLAKGFYDRLPAVRAVALELAILDEEAVRGLAADGGICPYHLSQELAKWCDVVVADYNYFFDSSAMLHALTMQNDWRIAVLVDEAHNMVPRARGMYSATLDPTVFEAALPAASGRVRRQLHLVRRAWSAVSGDRQDEYFVEPGPPADLITHLQRMITAITDDLVENAEVGEPVLRVCFDALHFCRMAESFGTHALFDVSRRGTETILCIRNVCPAPYLAPRFAACATAVLFSATLSPPDYYRKLLGLSADVPWVDVGSPFVAHQLEVRVARNISTRYRDRASTLIPMVDLIARQYQSRPGNYLAFFGSFEYLNSALAVFENRHPDIAVWVQQRGMDGAARLAFLERFSEAGCGIGFAVLGGVFAEGIDLPGERLIGAFIATLGMPGVNDVNAQIERRMQTLFDAGFEYTYLYPGLQKVVQAAGRIIRGVTDRGTLHLIDDRYLDPRVRGLLPNWWRIQCT